MRIRGVLAALFTAALVAGCGGGGGSVPEDSPGQTQAGPNDADIAIVRLIQQPGGSLDLNATQFFGDLASIPESALVEFAPTRQRIGVRLQRRAAAAGEEMRSLLPQASAAGAAGQAAAEAFDQLSQCGRQAAAFFRDAASGDLSERALQQARSTCEDARAAYSEAEDLAAAVPAAAPTASAAPGGGTITLTNHALDDPQPGEVTASIAPGDTLTITYKVVSTGSFPANLTRDCDGRPTFDVRLIAAGSPSALDLASAGYSEQGEKSKVPARILSKDTVEMDLGTFTGVAGGAPTQLQVFLSNMRCPDPQTGTSYTPTFDAGTSDKLIVTVA